MVTPITSEELKRVYASAPSGRRYVETIELSHPLFSQTWYLTNDLQAWTFQIEGGYLRTFIVCPFRVVKPALDGKGQQDMPLVIDNVGRETMEEIERAAADPTSPIAVTFRAYLDIANSEPQTDPPLRLTLQDIEVTLSTITSTATRVDVLNKPFPTVLYRADRFPGLDR